MAMVDSPPKGLDANPLICSNGNYCTGTFVEPVSAGNADNRETADTSAGGGRRVRQQMPEDGQHKPADGQQWLSFCRGAERCR